MPDGFLNWRDRVSLLVRTPSDAFQTPLFEMHQEGHLRLVPASDALNELPIAVVFLQRFLMGHCLKFFSDFFHVVRNIRLPRW